MRRATILLTAAILTGVAVSMLRPAALQWTTGPLQHEAYVWQRRWDTAVTDAVRSPRELAALCVLHTELSFDGGRRTLARADVDYTALRDAGVPVGLALRIGPYRGPMVADDEAGRWVVDAAVQMLADAKAHDLVAAEVQIDFDAAERQLDDYRTWVAAIRAAAAPTPVVITALPSWLDRRAFGRLVRACDGYVLQVHSLGRDTLCDPRKAHAWVVDAARAADVPFRVALPTYSHRLTAGGAVRMLAADPEAMASLVQAWTAKRPMHMQGVIWFRLPVEGEALNWTWPTLAAVMAGRTPQPAVRAVTRAVEPGLVEVVVSNDGDAGGQAASRHSLTWEGDLLVADGLSGYAVTEREPGRLVLQWTTGDAPTLAPMQSRTIAWLRFAPDKDVHVEANPSMP